MFASAIMKVEELDLKTFTLKPGGYLLVVCDHSNYSKTACQLEEAGFILHPYISYLSSSEKIICMAQKPHLKPMTKNIERHGVGALNIGKCRVGNLKYKINGSGNDNMFHGNFSGEFNQERVGRFPANLIHNGQFDGLFPVSKGGHWSKTKTKGFGKFGNGESTYQGVGKKDKKEGSASRFFKSCPTQGDLIDYLKTLITPEGEECLIKV